MSLNNVSLDNSAGRAKHLGDLAQVFRHRHGTWRDLGQFLKREFRDPSGQGSMVGAASGLPRIACRHNGRHRAAIAAALGPPVSSPGFNHERYSRPCISHGSYDAGKNGGLIVHDLCIRAADFLKSIGKGDPAQATFRDFDYDPSSELPDSSPRVGSSQVSDAGPGDVEMSEDTTITQAAFLAAGGSDDEFDEGGFFDEEDVQSALMALGAGAEAMAPPPSSSITLSDMRSSADSASQLRARASSTKMRAATLAYLWGFADDPKELRKQFRRLRYDATAQVLHLCGCGICYSPAGGNVIGCAERSHLKLGSAEENATHRNHHAILGFANGEQYARQAALIHEYFHGSGIF